MNMLKTFAGAIALTGAGLASTTHAAVVFSDDFDSYTTGTNLAGQGGWTATTVAATPIQVAGATDKFAQVNTSGQDDFKVFTSGVSRVDGEDLLTSVEVTLSAAQATGDYFFHVSDPVGTTSNFYQRLFARSSGAGFQLGMLGSSGTGSVVTYGTTVLNFGQTYDVDIDWNFIAGIQNDTFDVTVDGSAYVTHTWNSTSVNEPATISAANLRQGTAANAPTVQVDNIVIDGDTLVPEPTSLAAVGLGAIAMLRRRRSR
jgi:trimeric autotransporter adhesin